MLEPFAIGAERGVIVDATRHVSPMAGQDFAVRGFLEIEDVEGLGRVSNEVKSFRGVLGQGTLLEESSDSAERSDIGTCCEKLEKFSAGRGGCCGVIHDGC